MLQTLGRSAESDGGHAYHKGFGKVDARSRPEDTDLCLRAAECDGGRIWIYESTRSPATRFRQPHHAPLFPRKVLLRGSA